jgi:hypothetical protein
MSGVSDFLRPDGLKFILAATLVVPSLAVVLLVPGFSLGEPAVPVMIAIPAGYVAACVIDRAIQSRTLKIAIASVAALVSIILGSLMIRSMTMVCDPVHDPGMVCDPVHVPDTPATASTVISTVVPDGTTPMIFDPVHEPGGCSNDVCSIAPGIATGLVAEKLDECQKKIGE